MEEKIAALKEACVRSTCSNKLNDARIAANMRVFNAFRSEFGNKKVETFSNPRMQFLAIDDLAINIQPELYAKVDGVQMIWKFGLCKDSRPEHIVRAILQMLAKATKQKGIDLPISHVRFLDTMSGHVYVENDPDNTIEKELRLKAKAFADLWENRN